MLCGPLLQGSELVLERHSHVGLRKDVDILSETSVTLILCFMRSYQCVLARSLASRYCSCRCPMSQSLKSCPKHMLAKTLLPRENYCSIQFSFSKQTSANFSRISSGLDRRVFCSSA